MWVHCPLQAVVVEGRATKRSVPENIHRVTFGKTEISQLGKKESSLVWGAITVAMCLDSPEQARMNVSGEKKPRRLFLLSSTAMRFLASFMHIWPVCFLPTAVVIPPLAFSVCAAHGRPRRRPGSSLFLLQLRYYKRNALEACTSALTPSLSQSVAP